MCCGLVECGVLGQVWCVVFVCGVMLVWWSRLLCSVFTNSNKKSKCTIRYINVETYTQKILPI